MNISKSSYIYDLPGDLISKKPAVPRDASRLMVLTRANNSIKHSSFTQFTSFMETGSVLVINDTRVIPARLPGKRATGGSIEVLLLSEQIPGIWRCKVKNSARLKPGERLDLCDGILQAEYLDKDESGECRLRFDKPETFMNSLQQFGFAPLPPYIQKTRKNSAGRAEDLADYQTIFAREYGAIAAPTAGLHFTSRIINEVQKKNIELLKITLHVGPGTFNPVRVEDIRQHKMFEEEYIISKETAAKINQAKKLGRKITAVGTTVTRTLESAWKDGALQAGKNKTDLFIYPPYQFKVVDRLLTNFHLPESTLLMLISAFAGEDYIREAYQEAIKERYGFYSFGDCMFIQ